MSFTPTRVISESVSKSLLEFAQKNKVAPRLVDFELISFETLLQSIKSDATKIVDEVSESHLKNSNLKIIQRYTIEINILPIGYGKKDIVLSLSANQSRTKVSLNIKKESVFTNTPTFIKDLKKEIWKKKLSAGFLIDILEDNLDTQLLKLAKIVPYDKPLGKELKFTIAAGFLPLDPVDAKMDRIYEQKIAESNNMISGVDEGELIARYILPKYGTAGRTCDGNPIPTNKPKVLDKKSGIDQTITEKTLDDCIEYYANINGYPSIKNKVFTVSKSITLQGANFKSSGLIDSGSEDIDIAVNIQHNKCQSEDAIGSGVKIDVKELNVNGSIASNVAIAAQTLNIDAQTHSKSTLQVKETAKIKLHRGDLVAKDAIIDVLESGKITASNSAIIKQMLGGVVIAPIVKIDELLSNATIIASELIEIKSILGEHNKLIIDPNSIEQYHNDIDKLQEEIKAKKLFLAQTKEELEKRILEHTSKLDRIKTFQDKVKKAIQSSKTPLKQDVIRIKLYQKDTDKLNLEKEGLAEQTAVISSLELELDKLANKDLYAKIRSKTLYDGHTKIVFINVKTKEELFLIPEGRVEEIYLSLDENDKRVISTK